MFCRIRSPVSCGLRCRINGQSFRYTKTRFYSSRVLDPYSVLGVSKTATDDEIKKAYRKKARQYHPDVNKSPDATTKFQEISEAYEMIGSQQARRSHEYESKFNQQSSQQFYRTRAKNNSQQFTQEDFFEELFRQHAESMYGSSQRKSAYGSQQHQQHYNPRRDSHWYQEGPINGQQFFYEFGFDNRARAQFQYNSENLHGNFPRSYAMKESLIHDIPNTIKYTILHRESVDLGIVSHNLTNLSFQWQNHSGQNIARGTTTILENKFWRSKENIKVESDRGAHIGNIKITYFTAFPIFSHIRLFDKRNRSVSECYRFAFMGTRLIWKQEGAIAGAAFRGVVNIMGRIFDVDVSTRNDVVNPALYMFSILQSHRLDVQISPFRSLGRFLSRYISLKASK